MPNPSRSDLRIRVAEPGDLPQLDALFARSYPRLLRADYPPSIMVTAVPMLMRAQPALLASGTYYVSEAPDGTLLGAGGWTPRRDRRLGEIRHLVTDHRQTRRGIARAIIGHALQVARARGVVRMNCLSTRTAVPFYAAMGFDTLGPSEIALRPGISFPAIRMERRL